MSKLIWDKVGERLYETGVDHGVLYPIQTGGQYNKGVAWNGLSAVSYTHLDVYKRQSQILRHVSGCRYLSPDYGIPKHAVVFGNGSV